MSKNDLQFVITGKVRLSFVHVFTPYAHQQGNEPKYSTTILVPKSDFATKQKLDAAINAAIQQGVKEKFNGIKPPVLALPIYDGDGVRPSDGMPFGDECKGHWVFTASSKNKPEVVDIALNPIMNQSEIYSGIYGRVSVRFFPYAVSGKKGIGCGLGNVQKLEDGAPLGGRTSAVSDFDDANNFQQPAYQPPVYQQPVQQPVYQQPVQQPMYQQPVQQPAYQQPVQQPVQTDPITGQPIGGVMGI